MNFAGVQSVTIPEGDVRSVAIGGVTVWTKPNPLPYDAEVEYVASTGTQYVDTGVVANSTTDFEVRAIFNASNLVGVQVSAQRFRFGVVNDSKIGIMVMGQQYLSSVVDMTVPHTALAKLNGSGMARGSFVDGVRIGGISSISSATLPLFLFRANNGGSPIGNNPHRLYYSTIYQGGVLVRDLVPVRVGTAGYLYDRANPTGGPLGNGLYGSATSTPLVAGPDINGG